MLFCPHCGNMLLVEEITADNATEYRDLGMRFYCQTCPYIQPLRSGGDKVKKLMPLTRKKVDDVLGGDKAWENVDQTDAVCEACGNKRAYFMQIQIRSADEPMTIFYKCTACKKVWSA